jgi:hypothetical protein
MPRSSLRLLPALLVGAALATTPLAAVAQNITFSGSGTVVEPFAGLATGAFGFSFTLPQSPTPAFSSSAGFRLDGVTGAFTQVGATTSLTGSLFFLTAAFDGGFEFYGTGPGASVFNVDGPQLFSGTTAAPMFVLGSGTPTRNSGTVRTTVSSYTIAAVSTVPEPGTWALLGTGLLAVGGVAARRKRTAG